MFKLRLVALTVVVAALLLLALGTPGVAKADQHTNVCNVEDLWAASAFGSMPGDQGAVFFNIFNQVPDTGGMDDGSPEFALANQLALGLGNAGEGDKYHFRFETVLVSSGATAQGHGFLFVPPDPIMPTFVIAGHGTNPLNGDFMMSGGGNVLCAGEQGMFGTAQVDIEYRNGMTDNDVFVNMAHCTDPEPFSEGCRPPGD